MQIVLFLPHYQLVYINFDFSSFSLISYDVIANYLATQTKFFTPFLLLYDGRGTTCMAAAVRVVRQSSYYVYDGRRTTTECLINYEQTTIKH